MQLHVPRWWSRFMARTRSWSPISPDQAESARDEQKLPGAQLLKQCDNVIIPSITMFPIRKKETADSQIIIDPSILRHKPAKTCLIILMQNHYISRIQVQLSRALQSCAKHTVAIVLWSYPLIGWLRIWKSLVIFIYFWYPSRSSVIWSSLHLASQWVHRESHAFDKICFEKIPAPHLPP